MYFAKIIKNNNKKRIIVGNVNTVGKRELDTRQYLLQEL